MSLSPYAVAPEVVHSTRQLAHAMRKKGILPSALDGWLSADEMEIVKEVFAEPIFLNSHLYLRTYGLED